MNKGLFPTRGQAPDGKRLVAFTTDAADEKKMPPAHLTFVLNFFDELQRRK
jgi:hypothetical protein